ncbi:MAG: DUF5050 domain-containing protein [Sphaerochaetaceae bacterium]
MDRNRAVFCIALIIVVACLPGCVRMERIVIDGAAAQRIADQTVEAAIDQEALSRGNSAGNLRNGGYVLLNQEDLLYLNPMHFEDGSSVTYLQRLAVDQMGSDHARYDMLAELHGVMAGIWNGKLYYIDYDNGSRVTAMDLATTECETLDDLSVDALHLLDGTLYYSEASSGDIWQLTLGDVGTRSLVSKAVGTLVSISDGNIYAVDNRNGSQAAYCIPLAQTDMKTRLDGGPFGSPEVSGVYLFYIRDGQLWRQHLDYSVPELACVVPVAEYAIRGNQMVVASVGQGLFLARTDGSSLVQISADKASGVTFIGNRVFYRNGNDHDNVYVIDIVEWKRSIIQGDTLTDGGLQFGPLDEVAQKVFLERFGEQVMDLSTVYTDEDYYSGSLNGDVLMAEVPYGGFPVVFHGRLNAEVPSPDDVAALAVITYRTTRIGMYSDGGAADRIDTYLTLFAVDNSKPIVTFTIEGKPPTEIKHGAGDRIGIVRSWHQTMLDLLVAMDRSNR